MQLIHANKLGFAIGATGAIFYIGCNAVVFVVGKNATVWLFNSLLHGLDVSTIFRMEIPISESIIGIVLTFVLGWLMGLLIASIYNWKLK